MKNQVGGALIIFQFVSCSCHCFIIPILHCADKKNRDLRDVAANVVFELILAAVQRRPVLVELWTLWRRGNEKCYHRHQMCGTPDTDYETDSDDTVHIEANMTVLRTTALYPAADCPFL